MPPESPMQWDYDTTDNHAKVYDVNKANNQEQQSSLVVELDTDNMAPKRSISTNQIKCTACSDSIDTSAAARIHPLIGVLVCRKCYDSYGDGNFEKLEDGVDEAGDDNFCRWCVDGGDLFVCMNDNKKPTNDKCHYCFCRECLVRNVPDDPILLPDTNLDPNFKWHCYACDPKRLAKMRKDALDILHKLTGKKAENLNKKRKIDDNPTVAKTKVPVPTHKPNISKKISLTTSDVRVGTFSKTNATVTSSKPDTKDNSISTNKNLNANQTSISSSSKENISDPQILKRLEVYRKTKDVTIEEISSKFNVIVDMVSKKSSDKLLTIQIESLRTSMLEFETMITDLKSHLILKD